jgi:hypothetical protein
VHNLSIFIEVLASLRRDGETTVATIMAFEEFEGISSCDNACPLVVEQRCGVSFENGDAMTLRERFEGECRAETAQGASDLRWRQLRTAWKQGLDAIQSLCPVAYLCR